MNEKKAAASAQAQRASQFGLDRSAAGHVLVEVMTLAPNGEHGNSRTLTRSQH